MRDFDDRKAIIRAIISDDQDSLDAYQLSESEANFYSARAHRSLHETARKASAFKGYYALPTARPFLYVVIPSLGIAIAAIGFAILVYSLVDDPSRAAPIFAACLTITVIALGWTFAGWNSHNNTIRQNTNNLLFARFAHQAFSDALHRFHMHFGNDAKKLISWKEFVALRASADEDDRKAAASLIYILNYYEFIASGVVRGDLDKQVVRDNIRGNIEFYHDKCFLIISTARQSNPRTFEFLTKIRTHYREP